MFDLTGQKALVTGASGGIGGGIARALYAAGATVGLSGTRVDALEALAQSLGERAVPLPANLSAETGPEDLIKATEEKLGGIDVLVNNAGITRDTLAMRMKNEDWQTVLDVNLTSGFRLIKASLRGMLKQRHGRIIGITSIVGVTGNPGQTNYAAAKAGMIGMSKSLAYEVANRGITVNCIAPGFIATAMTDALNDDQKAGLIARVPAGRLGTDDDVAAAVVYLSSQEAGYITGQTLHINGGMAMI